MDCTHPVLYSRNCVLYCQICGAVIDPPKAEKSPDAEFEKPKPAPKRGKKPNAD